MWLLKLLSRKNLKIIFICFSLLVFTSILGLYINERASNKILNEKIENVETKLSLLSEELEKARQANEALEAAILDTKNQLNTAELNHLSLRANLEDAEKNLLGDNKYLPYTGETSFSFGKDDTSLVVNTIDPGMTDNLSELRIDALWDSYRLNRGDKK